MDEKARFQKIQSQLERYLYEYKNSFPKNTWQMIGIDLPIVILIVSMFVVIRLMGISLWSLLLILLMVLPYVLIWTTKSNSIWTKIWKKRKTFRTDNQAIKDKISGIDTTEFVKYPDVKQYLETYQRELSAETIRKDSIQKRYKMIMVIGSALLLIGAALTFTTTTKLSIFQDKQQTSQQEEVQEEIRNEFIEENGFIKYLNLTETEPVARIAPLFKQYDIQIVTSEADVINKTISIYFKEGIAPVLTMQMPVMQKNAYFKDNSYRLMITDTTGRPVSGIPYFDFSDKTKEFKIISSYPITFDLESHPYEIVRRVKYLQDNAENLRYTIVLLKSVQ